MAKPVKKRQHREVSASWALPASEVDPALLPKKAEILRNYLANPTKEGCRSFAASIQEWHDNNLWVHVAESWEDFLVKTLDCPPEWVEIIVGSVKVLDGSKLEESLVKSIEQKAAEAQPVAKPGRPPKIDRGKVLELREQGMSQRAIADRLGVSQQGVSNALTTNPDIIRIGGDGDPSPVLSRDYGTSQDYLLRRIRTEAPELLDDIGKGKAHKSARSAAIAAGIIKPSKQFSVNPGTDPAKIAAKLLDYDPDLAKAIARAILAE